MPKAIGFNLKQNQVSWYKTINMDGTPVLITRNM